MAARDRFGGFATEPPQTPLQRYIQNACDPQNFEPNLALNLEIADLINAKKGTAPREAAIAMVNHVNNRNPNVSFLALSLLDICVKNCGYPFHLQISTKEFLNELVRRFPERPPLRYSRVQNKILELIEEWRQTICQTSKYREDLGFVRDMHRLLSYKGYSFPAVKREDAAVLNPSEALRSAEEMEEEEKAAQSAKLQELIRRGTPHDLQEANKLMKVMAGYDNRSKTDYRAKAAEEVGKVQQKARILEEMLQEQKKGGDAINDDGFEELASALASAQPKIQKMCEEESDDTEAVAKLFEINDSIHRTLQRYRLVKSGDIEGAERIPKGTLGTSGAGVSKGADNELSLIDLGGDEPLSTTNASGSSANTAGASLEDDLLGLSMGQGAISLSTGASQTSGLATTAQPPRMSNTDVLSLFGGNSSIPATQSTIPLIPPILQQPKTMQPSQQAIDPFFTLSSTSTPRQASPFQFQQSTKPPPPLNPSSGLATSQISSNGHAQDDDWTFSSALPDQVQEVQVTNAKLHVVFLVSRPSGVDGDISIKSNMSNNTPSLISDLTFQAAVQKSLQLKMEPQSGRQLQPHQRAGITQTMRLSGVEAGKGLTVKVRWKASYWLGSERKEEQGEINSLGVP